MRKKASSQSRSARSLASPEQPLEALGMLVVVELGGEWPSQASFPSSPSSPSPSLSLSPPVMMRRVLAQAEGEAPGTFAERVADSLDGLFGRGILLQTVVLACNERVDDAAESARRKTVSLALGSMAKHKSGRAYLAASSRSSGRLRHALAALAQGLFDEWRTAGLEVSVDFGDESRLTEAAPSQFVFTARVA